ncbi:hypothetical protein SAMN05428977_1001100 [Nitrosomonas sp. Nm166]|nr:hypothetical protein SAMN05428977_1001100 [Nitrosomonas sp. Nm166]
MNSLDQLKDLNRRVFIKGIGYVSLGLLSSGMLGVANPLMSVL